ncbi:MAG: hypothetical protein HY347_10005 [candidate division NC10 bacterium]|nr:hypothetical protein [candidate division NC10 bacterium]
MRGVGLFIILLAVSLRSTAGGMEDPALASNGCEYSDGFEFVMGTDSYTPPTIPMPPKGTCMADPNFYTKIVRMTDKRLDGYSGPGIENEYSKVDPENSDGTLLILRGNDGSWYLYNASTYQMIEVLSDTVFGECGWEEPEPRWDPSDPKIFYYLCSTDPPNTIELRSYNIDTDTSTTIHDFKNEFPSAASLTTKTEGDASLDRRYWCFMVQDSEYNLLSVIVYDKTLDGIVGQKSSGFRDEVNWVGMSMSGNSCAIGWAAYVPPLTTTVVSRDFSQVIELPDGSAGHGDFALTADGRDVYVYQSVRTDHIAMADLNTGIETPLVEIPFPINLDIGLHISGNSSQTPGWVLVSTYGSKKPPQGSRHSWMDTQLFLVELKADPRIWRLAHTQSYTSFFYTGGKNYFAEAFAAINSKGTRVYFGSNWANWANWKHFFRRDYTETYQVRLPDDWVSTIPE